MGYITSYGNGLFLNTAFTQDTTNYPAPTGYQVALLKESPDRNSRANGLIEPDATIVGTSYINGADYYNISGGTYVTYSILPTQAMTTAFVDGQQISVFSINSTFNLINAITKNTVLNNVNTIAPLAIGTYAVGDVATFTNGNVTMYYTCISAITYSSTPTNPRTDTTHWAFTPMCNYTQFTVFVASTISTSWTWTTGSSYGSVNANTGYSRVSYGLGSDWTYGQGSVFNTNIINFTTPYSDWGNIVGWALLDTESPTNHVIACGDLQQVIYVQQNALVSLPAGSLRLYLN